MEDVVLSGCRPRGEIVEDESVADAVDNFQVSVGLHITHWCRSAVFADTAGLRCLDVLFSTLLLDRGIRQLGEPAEGR